MEDKDVAAGTTTTGTVAVNTKIEKDEWMALFKLVAIIASLVVLIVLLFNQKVDVDNKDGYIPEYVTLVETPKCTHYLTRFIQNGCVYVDGAVQTEYPVESISVIYKAYDKDGVTLGTYEGFTGQLNAGERGKFRVTIAGKDTRSVKLLGVYIVKDS